MRVNGFLCAVAATLVLGSASGQTFQNGGFESSTAGSPPGSPWTVVTGGSHMVRNTPDCGMPTEGSKYLEVSANGTGPGNPPTPTTGFGTPASGSAQVTQTFAGPAAVTGTLVFINGEGGAQTTYNDFACVQVAALGQTYTLAYRDTLSPASGTSTVHAGSPCTGVLNFNADLVTLFPAANGSTIFTLALHASNKGDGIVPSWAYVDNLVVGTPPPPPLASTFTNLGGGLWQLEVQSTTPNVELFNLIALQLANPVGSGGFLGMAADPALFVEISLPPNTPPFRVAMVGTTWTSPGYPIPSGLTIDEVSISLTGMTLVAYTNVQRFSF